MKISSKSSELSSPGVRGDAPGFRVSRLNSNFRLKSSAAGDERETSKGSGGGLLSEYQARVNTSDSLFLLTDTRLFLRRFGRRLATVPGGRPAVTDFAFKRLTRLEATTEATVAA